MQYVSPNINELVTHVPFSLCIFRQASALEGVTHALTLNGSIQQDEFVMFQVPNHFVTCLVNFLTNTGLSF